LVFLLSGIDDLIIDSIYWIWARKKKSMLKVEDLLAKEEKTHSGRRRGMERRRCHRQDGRECHQDDRLQDYDIFVGIYPNDEGQKNQY
jgi:hypothetical protein